MATYKFRNIITDEVQELEMSVTAIDQFKLDNPHMKQLVTGFAAVSNLSSTNNTPKGFRDLLNNIHNTTPGSVLGNHH